MDKTEQILLDLMCYPMVFHKQNQIAIKRIFILFGLIIYMPFTALFGLVFIGYLVFRFIFKNDFV